jgi:hypothetical protein
MKAIHLFEYKCLCGLRMNATLLKIFLRDLSKVINIINIDVIEMVNLRCDVTRYGDIDQEEGAVFTRSYHALRELLRDDWLTSTRRCDHDIGSFEELRELIKSSWVASELLSELNGAIHTSVRDEQPADSLLTEVSRCELPHLSRADQENLSLAEIFKNVARESDRDAAHRDYLSTNICLATHSPRDRKRPLHERAH